MRPTITLLVLALALAACGGGAPTLGTDVAVDEVLQGVEYYYACGDEVLELPDGRTFYPYPEQPVVDREALGVSLTLASADVLAVAPPGPGDDSGTLTVYDDGTARWRSDSGTTAWLTIEEQTYDWVC